VSVRRILGWVILGAAVAAGCAPAVTPTGIPPPSLIPPALSPATPTGPRAGTTTEIEATVRGVVVDEVGLPVPGATVRVQATANEARTDLEGRFALAVTGMELPVTISAWAEGYYCSKVDGVTPPLSDLTLRLRLYQTTDNPNYAWVPPTGENSCYSCKPGVTQVWLDHDAHSRSAANQRFLTMYNGTDVAGNRSPLTRYGYSKDYGRFPLRPDPDQPYYGPGYRLDFPESAGNCAACHTPGPSIADPYGVDPNTVDRVELFGIHCDFCHKIADVRLDPSTGLPYPNMPGVLSMDIRRPFPDDPERYQLFFGTFDDDNVPEEDTYLPLIEQSEFCAPCHFGVFWDTVVYNSFGEWLASPYSDPETGKTCQRCHMPAPTLLNGQALTNVAPEKGGVERDPNAVHAHTFPGAASEELLQNAVSMMVHAERKEAQLLVEVSITNDQTGHHVPTDSPLRQMILVVRAKDARGNGLALTEGPVLTEWAGVGDPALGYFAGLPGMTYARILQEVWTEVTPSGAYWNPTRVFSDNRLAAFATDTTQYVFDASRSRGPLSIEARLLFRRAFIELVDQKEWDVPDVVMEESAVSVP
jgi:hypothetical protein